MRLSRPYRPRLDPVAEPEPLTLYDERHPLMPWLPASAPQFPPEDIAYARCWAYAHAPVENIGSLQVPVAPPIERAARLPDSQPKPDRLYLSVREQLAAMLRAYG